MGGRRLAPAGRLHTRHNAARAASGDAGDQQPLIKTLQKKGFRFIGRVQEINKPDETTDANSAVQLPAPAPSDKPSIAVLPFQNLPADPEQENFPDRLAYATTTHPPPFRPSFTTA